LKSRAKAKKLICAKELFPKDNEEENVSEEVDLSSNADPKLASTLSESKKRSLSLEEVFLKTIFN